MTAAEIEAFQGAVYRAYHRYGRTMPWRDDTRPYYILVSELMLQQTQVARVVPKFEAFVARFPTVQSLADARLAEVLRLWSGLGYNRRARYLHEAARHISARYGGQVPADTARLVALPGIGPNTAGAIQAYAFNRPAIFIETNVRSVYLHHFFADEQQVADEKIRHLLAATIDTTNPRHWYWALMDYGSHLKAAAGNNIANSKHYKKQSVFAGSLRQMRGQLLRELGRQPLRRAALEERIGADARLHPALDGLLRDGLIEERAGRLGLTGHREGG